MAFFTKGILLEQHKEPMLTRNVLVMRQEYEYFDCSFPDVPVEELSAEQIIEIARLAGIVDESDGLMLADKLEKATLSTIEEGKMTKDLARITSLENVTTLNSKDFILAIRENLEKML